MVEEQPMFLTNLCYTFAEFRRELGGLVCTEGISGRTSLGVTTGGSGLDVFAAAGGAFIQGDDDPDQGMYWVRNDAQITLTATTADATNPRIDTVVATVRDSDFGGTDDDWILQILPGTPTVGATLVNLTGAAALPDNSIRLAYILVPATFAGPFVDATHILDARSSFVSCGDRNVRSTTFSRASTQSLANSAVTTITFPVASTGTAQGNDWLTESAGTVTIKRAGVYTISGYVRYEANATGYRRALLLINGATDSSSQFQASPTLTTDASVTNTYSLAAGATVVLSGRQSSGGALNVDLASLTVTRVGTLVP